MKRTATEYIRHLELRVARLERQALNRLPPGESPVKLDSRVKSNLERQTRDRVSNYETLDMGLGKYEKNYLVKVNFSGSSEPLFAIVVQDRINKVQSSFFSGTDYNKMQKLFNDKFKK